MSEELETEKRSDVELRERVEAYIAKLRREGSTEIALELGRFVFDPNAPDKALLIRSKKLLTKASKFLEGTQVGDPFHVLNMQIQALLNDMKEVPNDE